MSSPSAPSTPPAASAPSSPSTTVALTAQAPAKPVSDTTSPVSSPTAAPASINEPASPISTVSPSEIETVAPSQLTDLVESLSLVPIDDIRDVDYSRLKAVLSQLKAGLDTSSRSLAQIRRTAKRSQPAQPVVVQDHSPFDFAYAQVRACEVALRASIEAASTATPETAAELQAKVAQNYEAYSRAVTVAQATAKNYLADNSGSRR